MKKTLIAMLLVVTMLFSLSSCSVMEQLLPYIEEILGGSIGSETKTYVDFTPGEKATIKKQLGCDLPFIANNEYYLDDYTYSGERGVSFLAFGNSQAEFLEYRNIFADFSYLGSSKDSYGHVWYSYENDGVMYDLTYYTTDDGKGCIELVAYVYTNDNQGGDDNGSGNDNNQNSGSHKYTGFTDSERELFAEFAGFVIPFIANDDYSVETYTYEDEIGINFYTFGNTEAEYNAYRREFSIYTFVESFEDSYGDTWYTYSKDGFFIDISYYLYDSTYGWCVDVYVYKLSEGGEDNGSDYTYTSFTSDERSLFMQYFGEAIPFLPNDEYYVEEYTFEDEVGINFYTFGNTTSDFENYRAKFSGFTLVETYTDEYGDMWYTYSNGKYYVDMAHYETESYGWCVDIYIFTYGDDNTGGNSGNGGNGGNGGNTGAGNLPSADGGVFQVDFTRAKNVKNVTDQGYYEDGCPTTGSPAVLVIPVEFRDATAAGKGYTTEAIKNAFMKGGECDYYSVYDYYFTSSYGQLSLDITVLDSWFRPQYSSSYYANATIDYFGEQVAIGEQIIMDEALAYLSGIMDLSKYDSDGNNIIDAVVLINTLEIGDDNFYWAFRYWNLYTDDDGYYYEYDGVSANDYMWASYQFLYESENGNSFDDKSAMNTYTFIHEFGHILGADDYYDTAGVGEPMGGCDIMDCMKGDHNAFTKFNYGWLTKSRLVVTDTSVTLTLEDFTKNGDTIIIANQWDETLGAYQEYYIVVYYTSNGLNDNDVGGGYFSRDGIVVYHVNATLYEEEYDGEIYYDIYNNNTDYSDEYGTKNNLIEFVLSGNDTYTYVVGDTLPSVTDDNGLALGYTFTVDNLDGEYATITFTKR